MCLPPLYKFLDVRGAKLTFGNRTFKFAKPSDFNDVEDPTIQSVFPEAIEAALRRLARSFTDVVMRNLDKVKVCDEPHRTKIMMIQEAFRNNPEAVEVARQHDRQQDADNVERFRAQAEDLLAQLNASLQTWRVLCVTSDIASERMWSDYAQNHRGVALRIVGASAKDSKFQLFRPVDYLETRPPLYRNTLDFMEGYFFADPGARTTEMIRRIIYSKTLQWRDEKEYRLAIPVGQEEEDWKHLAVPSGRDAGDQAQEAIRGLIDKVVLTPVDGVLQVDLHGEIAAILQLCAAGKKGRLELDANAKQLVMVAGARNRHYLLFNALGLNSTVPASVSC